MSAWLLPNLDNASTAQPIARLALSARAPHLPHLVMQLHTKSRAYGMYDSVYQISARNWTMIIRMTGKTSFTCKEKGEVGAVGNGHCPATAR